MLSVYSHDNPATSILHFNPIILISSLFILQIACSSSSGNDGEVDGGAAADGDVDTDGDVDGDGDTDSDTDADSDTDLDAGGDGDSDGDGDAGADGDSDSDGDTDSAGLAEGCPGQLLRDVPEDLGAPGPWPVGALTTKISGMSVEVWYPAEPGSEAGADRVLYDIRDHLPDPSKVSEEENPIQECDCHRDLPLDDAAGPYPVVVFVHGTAGFRTTNLGQVVHWASRGFVVAAADHPHITFKDMVSNPLGTLLANQAGDARKIFLAIEEASGDLGFLEGNVDLERTGAMGHSAGAGAVSGLGDVADVIIPYAGGNATGDKVASVMFIAGNKDSMGNVGGYTNSQPIKRSVLVAGGGHLVGGSLCELRDPRDSTRDLLDIIQENNIGGALGDMAGGLFQGCNEDADDDDGEFINELTGIDILNYATAGVLEETLQCSETAREELAEIGTVFGEHIEQYREQLQ